jgi:N-acetylglucosaminyldiphosphoundecaprenol N-acetyl-beta-D-mannosaminyltransferase
MRRAVRIGRIPVDCLTTAEVFRKIELMVRARAGGAIFTPNVDHVVIAESNETFRAAYQCATLSLADGMPLVWLSRILRRPIPERVAGSDLFAPLMELAAEHRWRVYLLGGTDGVAEAVARRLRERPGVNVVGCDSPIVRPDGSELSEDSVKRVRAARADLMVVALGTPKQELWIHRVRNLVGPTVVLGFGASLDFFLGRQKRAPRWAATAGLEWLYRLVHEPRRLWRRYLVRDLRFIPIALRTLFQFSRENQGSASR